MDVDVPRDMDGCLDFLNDIDTASFVAVRVRLLFESLPSIGCHWALFIVMMAGDMYICISCFLIEFKAKTTGVQFLAHTELVHMYSVHIMSLHVSITHG